MIFPIIILKLNRMRGKPMEKIAQRRESLETSRNWCLALGNKFQHILLILLDQLLEEVRERICSRCNQFENDKFGFHLLEHSVNTDDSNVHLDELKSCPAKKKSIMIRINNSI